jgi:hypothetical protein
MIAPSALPVLINTAEGRNRALFHSRIRIMMITIKKLRVGLDITLGEFFSTPEFDAMEQGIK